MAKHSRVTCIFERSPGVFQESVLWQIQFLIYTNDLPDLVQSLPVCWRHCRNCTVYLIVEGSNDGRELQNDLDRLSVSNPDGTYSSNPLNARW